MKVPVRDVLESRTGIEAVLGMKVSPLGNVSMPMARNFRKCQAAMKDYAEQRDRLKAELSEDTEEFKEAVKDLLDTEIELDIRVVPTERITASEEARPGFAYPDIFYYTCWFLVDLEEELKTNKANKRKKDEPTTES